MLNIAGRLSRIEAALTPSVGALKIIAMRDGATPAEIAAAQGRDFERRGGPWWLSLLFGSRRMAPPRYPLTSRWR